jgi:RNA polymerase sigma factor (sigma-70 family)
MKFEKDELANTRWSLVKRLKDIDDQESWRDFFSTYWRLIYNVAVKSGLTPQEAEDVVQATVITVVKHIKNFNADPAAGSFKAWLLKLAHSRISDEFRARPKENNARVHRCKSPVEGDTVSTSTVDRLPDPNGNFVEAIWEEEWKKNLISNALEKVKAHSNARDFQIFYLYALKGHKPEKVAAITKVSVSYVYVVKTRIKPVFEAAIRLIDQDCPAVLDPEITLEESGE